MGIHQLLLIATLLNLDQAMGTLDMPADLPPLPLLGDREKRVDRTLVGC
jgi:hypothetical protein